MIFLFFLECVTQVKIGGKKYNLKVKSAQGVSQQFFLIWTRVLKNNKYMYVEIKQFSKVEIKQNNISTVILLIKFLV